MITDAEIREHGYSYFLTEAPELLQTIEQELFSFLEGNRTTKVHTLMRATHTLKGGAATVGLKEIQIIAHSLEDIFKALYNPDVVIDDELLTLLLKAYECLRLALTAELTSTAVNVEEILQRATDIFIELQEKLGDAFGNETHIPTSEELGFDITKSIFEVGVQQRLENIAATINNPPNDAEFRDFLNSQADVFLGLAESLNLPGLGELAQTIMTALQVNPSQVQQIAEIALQDLQAVQTAVLSGDRICLPSISPTWQQLTKSVEYQVYQEIENYPPPACQLLESAAEFYEFLTKSGSSNYECIKPTTAKLYLKLIQYIFGWFHHEKEMTQQQLNLSLLIPQTDVADQINYIKHWLKEFLSFLQNPEDSYSLYVYRHGILLITLLAVAKFQYYFDRSDRYLLLIKKLQNQIHLLAKEYKNYPPVNTQEKNWLDHPKLQYLLEIKTTSTPVLPEIDENLLESLWGGNTEISPPQIEPDNHDESSVKGQAVVEIIPDAVNENLALKDKVAIANNTNLQQPSFVRVKVEKLRELNYLSGELLIHQRKRSLYDEQMQELTTKLMQQLNQHQVALQRLKDLPLNWSNIASPTTQNFASIKFDTLEMDVYTEFNLSLHTALEEALQLQEATESLELLLKQAIPVTEKKQNLIFTIIDNVMEVRMLPLGDILNRFSPMVQQLGSIYHKNVALQLTGTEVLVDKAIAEKLYDPLLHLVRNAFDHGIEFPEMRRELGKPEQGLIEIRAYHQSSQTIIEVRDDGQGLNLDKIRKKASEMKLISANEQESELLDLMFTPGLSTVDQVSDISGRGMGLDIVRSQMAALHGSISVQTLPHQGTKFTLKIPFSMTTDKLMLVQAGGVVYALLLESVKKILIPSVQQIKEFEGKRVLQWNTDQDETLVNLYRLSELISYNCSSFRSNSFNNNQTSLDKGLINNPILILKHEQTIFGLEVDQVIGEQELVIRPLGNAIAPPKYVYGCSSSANGNLILVIDGSLLLESINMQIKPEIPIISTVSSSSQLLAVTESNSTDTNPIQTQFNQHIQTNYPKVILVVDDAISLRQTLAMTLQRGGYEVIQAQNGVEALEQLQRYPNIQTIISDLEMPHMNGFEFLSNVRQNPNFAKIPVLILSSRSAEKHRQLAKELGANAYLTKPYLEHELLSNITSLLDTKKDLAVPMLNHS